MVGEGAVRDGAAGIVDGDDAHLVGRLWFSCSGWGGWMDNAEWEWNVKKMLGDVLLGVHNVL